MVTRLVIAKLTSLAFKTAKKTFRKKTSAHQQAKSQSGHLNKSAQGERIETGEEAVAPEHFASDKNSH